MYSSYKHGLPEPDNQLIGLNILNGRPVDQAGELSSLLRRYSASVFEFPLIKILRNFNKTAFEGDLENFSPEDWVVCTSSNSAFVFTEIPKLKLFNVAAVGETTAGVLRKHGANVEFVSVEQTARGLAKELIVFFEKHKDRKPKRILFLRGSRAKRDLISSLKDSGIDVVDVEVYQSECPDFTVDNTTELIDFFKIHDSKNKIIVITSEYALDNFIKISLETKIIEDVLQCPIVVIGPNTSLKAKQVGFSNIKTPPIIKGQSGFIKIVQEVLSLS